jgi:hypothetical protein
MTSFRQLLIVSKASNRIVATRDEHMQRPGCARITKPLYNLLKDGSHIAFYAHKPQEIRVPMEIEGRFYAKPSKYRKTPKTTPVAIDMSKYDC